MDTKDQPEDTKCNVCRNVGKTSTNVSVQTQNSILYVAREPQYRGQGSYLGCSTIGKEPLRAWLPDVCFVDRLK
jgi:hypothetical protein